MKRLVAGLGVISFVGIGFCGVVYQRRLKENQSITATAYNAKQDQARLEEALRSLGGATPAPLFFYRYTTCPFCSKVKAMLDFHRIPHTCVEVEPMLKGEIKHSEYKKVPQLQFYDKKDGPFLVDSDVIVQRLAELKGQQAQLNDADVQKWRSYARDSLVRHLVVNINKSLASAWGGYGYIDQFDTIPYANKLFLKVMGAPVMYMVSKFKTTPALLKSGELKENDDVREVLHRQVNRFVDEALVASPSPVTTLGATKKAAAVATSSTSAPSKPFHGGAVPDVADIDVYGVLQSVRGHEIYDDLIRTTKIRPWLDRMDAATGKAAYLPSH